MWDQLKKIISTTAPTLAAALGGPLAGTAVNALSKAVLGKESASEQELIHAVTSSHGSQKLALTEKEFKIRMQELKVDLEEINAQDRENARERETKITDITGKRDYTVSGLAFCIVGGFLGILVMLVFSDIDPDAKSILDIMAGVLGTITVQIINYFFGSSAGSKQKTTLLNGNGKH